MALPRVDLPLPQYPRSSVFVFDDERTFSIEWAMSELGPDYRACVFEGNEILRAQGEMRAWTGQPNLPSFTTPDNPTVPLFRLKSQFSITKPFFLEAPDGTPFLAFKPRTLSLKERFDVKFTGKYAQLGEKHGAAVVEDVTLEAKSMNNQSSEFQFMWKGRQVARMMRFLPGADQTMQTYPDFKVTVAPGVDLAMMFAVVVTFDISKEVA